MGVKLYIVGPSNKGEGVYHLLAETGEHLASHYCSNSSFACGDLEGRRPERKERWAERFGAYEVLNLGDDSMSGEELFRRNRERGAISPSADGCEATE